MSVETQQSAWSVVKESLNGKTYDFTQGDLKKAITLLAIPMILELSLESVFAVVDIFFVSKLGSNAIAAVGLTESVITIVYSIAIGVSTAATAIVARRVGEKNPDAAARAGAQSMIISIAIAVVFSIAGAWFAADILRLMGASDAVVAEGSVFTRTMFGGSLSVILIFVINGIFRGAGDAAMAMKSLWAANLVNIVLCPILIHFFGLKGAAIATVIGRSAGVLYQLYHLFNGRGVVKLKSSEFEIDLPLVRSIVSIALPAGAQFLIASGSWIFLARLVAETGGTDASAGYQIAIRNVVFFILPAWGLSNAAATLVGQNLGANNPDRAEQSVILATKYNIIFMAGVMALFLSVPRAIMQLFTADAAVIEYGAQALRIIGAGYIFYGIGMVMTQALNGAGDSKTPTVINIIGFWLIQIPLAYFLAKGLGWNTTGAFAAVPIAETLIAVMAWFMFRKGAWKQTLV